jgi:hypothetical protein
MRKLFVGAVIALGYLKLRPLHQTETQITFWLSGMRRICS